MKIGITYNLRPAEPALSEDAFEEFDSPETIEAICKVLTDLGHAPLKLGYGKLAIEKILSDNPDFVFNIAEGHFGRSREAHMPALLEMLKIPYSGPDPLTAALTLDKIMAKKIAGFSGVSTPSYSIIMAEEDFDFSALEFPLILKLAYEGSSKGLRSHSRVENIAQAKKQAAWLRENYPPQPILAEQFISGREITVGVIGNGNPQILGMMEIKPKDGNLDNFIYSLEVKRDYLARVDYQSPPELSDPLKQRIEKSALQLYRVFGCRDIARFDFRIDNLDAPSFLEVNPLPGLNPISGDIVIMAKLLGIEYNQLIAQIINQAFLRYGYL